MPFITEAQRQCAVLPASDPTRLTLEYLLQNRRGVGCANAISTQDILDHLAARQHQMSRETFQQTILNATRDGQVFIGVCRRGLYIIENRADAIATRDFYEARISSEQRHLDNLRNLVHAEHWPRI